MNKKVLLIEDDKIVRENITEILELANYTVQTAKNGKVGVALASSFLPDIIVCDILMPELDGYGVLQIVSKNPDLEHVPFIFLTAKTTHEDVRRGMELGADDYINKPFEESELLRAIETRLKKARIFEKRKSKQNIISLHKKTLKNIKNLSHFLAQKKVFNYNPGETVYCQGNSSNHIFLVKKGLVKTYMLDEFGKELITGYFAEEQYFGYKSFIGDIPHFENSKAITATQLYKINKDEMSAILTNNHEIIYNFIDLMNTNLIRTKKQLMKQAYGSVRKKTASTILELLEILPVKNNNEIEINRTNLANTVGIAKETLIRTLKDFKEEHLIELHPKSIKILDKRKLQSIK